MFEECALELLVHFVGPYLTLAAIGFNICSLDEAEGPQAVLFRVGSEKDRRGGLVRLYPLGLPRHPLEMVGYLLGYFALLQLVSDAEMVAH